MKKITNKQLDDDIWNLDQSFYAWIIPRLKRFEATNTGTPSILTPRKWKTIIRKMIIGMEIQFNRNEKDINLTKKEQKQSDQSMELFAKYIHWLWIQGDKKMNKFDEITKQQIKDGRIIMPSFWKKIYFTIHFFTKNRE